VVPARRSLASVIALPVSSRSPRGEGIAPREDDSPSRCPRRLGDADPPGVRAAWSPGALTRLGEALCLSEPVAIRSVFTWDPEYIDALWHLKILQSWQML
jgi:hypothetical protein